MRGVVRVSLAVVLVLAGCRPDASDRQDQSPEGFTHIVYPDGVTYALYPDGATEVVHPDGPHAERQVPIAYGRIFARAEPIILGLAVPGGCMYGVHGETATVCETHRVWKGEDGDQWRPLLFTFGEGLPGAVERQPPYRRVVDGARLSPETQMRKNMFVRWLVEAGGLPVAEVSSMLHDAESMRHLLEQGRRLLAPEAVGFFEGRWLAEQPDSVLRDANAARDLLDEDPLDWN